MAAGHFAGHFSAISGSGPVSHSVAGQQSLNAKLVQVGWDLQLAEGKRHP